MLSNSEYERWEKRFSVPDYVFGTAPNAFLKSQAHVLPKSGTALAVADGEGRNGVWLAERGLDVLSIDWSPTALGKAQALARRRGVTLRTVQVDVVRWQWPVAQTAMPALKSRNWLPSTSITTMPCPSLATIG